jgi:hypothetical protein
MLAYGNSTPAKPSVPPKVHRLRSIARELAPNTNTAVFVRGRIPSPFQFPPSVLGDFEEMAENNARCEVQSIRGPSAGSIEKLNAWRKRAAVQRRLSCIMGVGITLCAMLWLGLRLYK